MIYRVMGNETIDKLGNPVSRLPPFHHLTSAALHDLAMPDPLGSDMEFS